MLRRLSVVLLVGCSGSSAAPSDAALPDAAEAQADAALPDAPPPDAPLPDAPPLPDGPLPDAPLPPDAALPADAPIPDARPPDAPTPDAPPPDAGPIVCVATTGKQFGDCGVMVKNGLAGIVEVRGVINCSGIDDCDLFMNAFTGTVVIRGAPGAVIRRTDRTDYQIIDINGGRVIVQDLILDLGKATACVPVSGSPPVDNLNCLQAIRVTDADEAIVERVTIAYPKRSAVTFNDVKRARVSDSRFIGSHLDGIVAGTTGELIIERTLIQDSATHGIRLENVHGTADDPLLLRDDLLVNNHRQNPYLACGDGNDPCDGAQILGKGVELLRITGVVAKSGEGVGASVTSGLELDPAARDVEILSSDLHGHDGYGVLAATGGLRIELADNELYGNAKGDVAPGPAMEAGSCHTARCNAVPLGMLWALPGALTWTSNDLAAPVVKVNGTMMSTQPSGTLAPAKGATVVLYDGETELDRLVMP